MATSDMKEFVKETLGEELTDLMEQLKDQVFKDLFGPGPATDAESAEKASHFKAVFEKLNVKLENVLAEHDLESSAQLIRDDYEELLKEVHATVAQAASDPKAAEILVCARNLLRGIVDHPNLRTLLTGAHEKVQKKLEGSSIAETLGGMSDTMDEAYLSKSVENLEFLLFRYRSGDDIKGSKEQLDQIMEDPALQKVKEFVDVVQDKTANGIKLKTNDWVSTIKNGLPVAHERLQSWKDDVVESRETNKAVESVTVGMDFLSESRVKYVMDTLDNLESEKLVNELDASLGSGGDGSNIQDRIKTFFADTVSQTIPNMSVPEIEGERDKVKYHITDLDLSGVNLPPKGTKIDFADLEGISRGDPFVAASVKNVSAVMKGLKWRFKQQFFPYVNGDGLANADVQDLQISLGFQLYKIRPSEERKAKLESAEAEVQEKAAGESNNVNNNNQANHEHGAKTTNTNTATDVTGHEDESDDYQPRIAVAYCHVDIGDIVAKIEGHWLSWLYNTLSELFSNTVKSYLISVMEDSILETLNERLTGVNEFVQANWGAISQLFEINLAKLPTLAVATARAEEIVENLVSEAQRSDHYSVSFPRMGPIGIKFQASGDDVVVDRLTRLRGAILPAEASGKIAPGDSLISCNGQRMAGLPLERVMLRLRAARRPLVLVFQPNAGKASGNDDGQEPGRENPVMIALDDQKLHMIIKETVHGTGVLVNGFGKRPDGSLGQAEACGKIKVGMIMVSVNGTDISKVPFSDAVKVISESKERPINLGFMQNPDRSIQFKQTPVDLKLGMFGKGYVITTGFGHIKGPAEVQCGDVLKKGFVVRKINDKNVLSLGFQSTVLALKNSPRPVRIEFGPPPSDPSASQGEVCVATFGPGPLGLMFYRSDSDHAAFKAYSEFPGPARRSGLIREGLVVQTVNGEALELQNGLEGVEKQINSASLPVTITFRDMELQQKVYGGDELRVAEEEATTEAEPPTPPSS